MSEEIKSAKEIYDEKILASLTGNDFPTHLQNICMNSIKFKEERLGTREERPSVYTGMECEAGVAKDKLAYCESCMTYKYMRNQNDVV